MDGPDSVFGMWAPEMTAQLNTKYQKHLQNKSKNLKHIENSTQAHPPTITFHHKQLKMVHTLAANDCNSGAVGWFILHFSNVASGVREFQRRSAVLEFQASDAGPRPRMFQPGFERCCGSENSKCKRLGSGFFKWGKSSRISKPLKYPAFLWSF